MAGIDHAFLLVEDLDAAASAMRSMGFQLTPKGVHIGRGTANHLVLFPGAYLELLGCEEEQGSPPRYLDNGIGRPGIWGLALATDNISRDLRRLAAHSVTAGLVQHLERPLEVDGRIMRARFDVVDLDLTARLDAATFACAHRTPELVWQTPLPVHPAASRFDGMAVTSTRPEETKTLIAALIDGEVVGDTVRRDDFGMTVFLPDSFASIVPSLTVRRANIGPAALAGVAFTTSDLPGQHRRLEQAAFKPIVGNDVIHVQCRALGDAVFSFRAA